ncbi:MAG: ATP-binding cassette domain-containing protein [Spirochaetaceae bacterium]|jgi:oligopeptide transport system ATP-binding protein|nr:ATP-binding cassette domain-containing protein [Spirochaetaceae bacterium]
MEEKLLEVKELKTFFTLKSDKIGGTPAIVKAVNDLTFDVNKGEILGIVGESGCGKSTLGRTIMRLNHKTEGEILYKGENIFQMEKKELKDFRKQIQMVFQDPFSSLNPRKKVGDLLAQPLKIHGMTDNNEINIKIDQIMKEVGINPVYKGRFPHQFSGGQRQRIGIARALMLNPDFIICDEAVSALDVSIQAQVLNLLLDLHDKYKFTYIFIAHDLAVVEFISTRILVMYLGKIVESAEKHELVNKHLHPYSQALFNAFPATDPKGREKKEQVIMGDVPSPINPPTGCYFHPRCKHVMDKCKVEYPELVEVSPGHKVACWLHS